MLWVPLVKLIQIKCHNYFWVFFSRYWSTRCVFQHSFLLHNFSLFPSRGTSVNVGAAFCRKGITSGVAQKELPQIQQHIKHSAKQAFQITPGGQERKPQTKPKQKLKDIWFIFYQVWTQLKDPEGADSRILPSVLTACIWSYAMILCLPYIFYNIHFTQRAISKT